MQQFIFSIITDKWVLFGFVAQGIFFMRFIVQWLASEKAKQSVIPPSFWYLSIVGTLMILIYAIKKQDIVFIIASILNTGMYLRNIMLIKQSHVPTN